MVRILSVVLASLSVLPGRTAGAREPEGRTHEIRSPDGRIVAMVTLPEPGSADVPSWSASFLGKTRLQGCRIGLSAGGEADLLAGAALLSVKRRTHDEVVPMVFGRADRARDRFAELVLALRREGSPSVRLVFRCHDDAVSYRIEVGEAGEAGKCRITAEGTAFSFTGAPVLHAQHLKHFRTSHEHPVTAATAAAIPAGQLLDLPLTAVWPDGTVASITEAALLRYAGLSLRRAQDSTLLEAALAPRDDGVLVERPLPLRTPWRVVLLADRLGALLESTTLWRLNDPPDFDSSWVRPGKLTWPWWNGSLFEARRTEPILSVESARRYIDWCAANGIDFHALVADETDTPWYVQSRKGFFPGPDTDASRPREGFDLAVVRRYADAKGVRLWTWVHHGAVRGRVEAVFRALAAHGFGGVMVDFLDSDDQETVEFAEDVLRSAARHHVLVHFHGMYKPTGWQRTFPHLMNHEGSLNLEYLKWTDLCTPEHTLRVVFTRLVAGPMDYHLGGFRAVHRKGFRPRNEAPEVLGTRAHHLALYVCIDNPAPMVADYPAAYEGQAGFEFIREVPTWWDETRVLAADMGRLLVTARRRGDVWWLGGLVAGEVREIDLALSFLPEGRHELRLWRDGDRVAADPDDLVVERREVAAPTSLRLKVGEGGGFAACIAPASGGGGAR